MKRLDVPSFTDRTRASLKIQEGCNNFCTFCIIPWARGLMRSRDPKEVIKQAQQLVDAGYKEIVLTGIHTGGYGEDLKDYNLAMLLRDIEEKVKGLKRLRISSIEASQITDEVIEVLEKSKVVVTSFAYSDSIRIRYCFEKNATKVYNGILCRETFRSLERSVILVLRLHQM